MFFIWPVIQSSIYSVGDLVLNSGYAGTWVYGFMERLLIPFGLHHVFYLPFWQTAVGGTMAVGGQLIEGAQNIFFAQLADPTVTEFSVSATRFMSGKFPLMILGLPGAALAMYKTAKPEKKKEVEGLLYIHDYRNYRAVRIHIPFCCTFTLCHTLCICGTCIYAYACI